MPHQINTCSTCSRTIHWPRNAQIGDVWNCSNCKTRTRMVPEGTPNAQRGYFGRSRPPKFGMLPEYKRKARKRKLSGQRYHRKSDAKFWDQTTLNEPKSKAGETEAWQPILIGAFLGLIVLGVLILAGKARAAQFDLTLCNYSNVSASVVMVSRLPASPKRWTTKGWWNVGPGRCLSAGQHMRGSVYLAAVGAGAHRWGGGDISSCVSNLGFVQDHRARCRPHERLINFDKITVSGSTFTWKLV